MEGEKLQEIYLTLARCKDFLDRQEKLGIEHSQRIREAEQRLIEINGKTTGLISSRQSSEQRFSDWQQIKIDVRELMSWKDFADRKMERISNAFWQSLMTTIASVALMVITGAIAYYSLKK
jgi:phosphoketolase